MAEPVCCFRVTLDYKIDFYIPGSNFIIFVIKTFSAAMHMIFSNFVLGQNWLKPKCCAECYAHPV
jgi:hypothetical protein